MRRETWWWIWSTIGPCQPWATGTALEWCETVIDPTAAGLDLGGDVELAAGLVEALHLRLWPFGGEPGGPPLPPR